MHTETLSGLHRCQPKNEPQVGAVKTFLVIHNPAKQGKKPWIAIKSAPEDKGGTPYKVVSVESTGWEPDQYGNQSYNLEVEAEQQGAEQGKPYDPDKDNIDWPDVEKPPVNAPQHPVQRSNGGDGVTEARKHLMQSANLYNLCVAAVDKAIAPWMPKVARTSEQFQAAVASLYIEASKEQWWSGKIVKPSLIDSMPTTPIKNGDQ